MNINFNITIDDKIIERLKKVFSKKTALFLSIPFICFATVLSISASGDRELVIFQPGNPVKAEEINQNFELLEEAVHLVVPAGTILPYGGTTIPDGWLLCDGASLNKDNYPRLFGAISTNWGGNGDPMFNLPDLRGRFLRGVDHGQGVDPDAFSRTDLSGDTITGDLVGSYQDDDYKLHSHTETYRGIVAYSDYDWRTPIEAHSDAGSRVTVPTGESGGNETRPKNASVNYIIKY